MQKYTNSILEELNSMYIIHNKNLLIESRATNVIDSAIHLIEEIHKLYPQEQAQDLERKLVNAIKLKDNSRFVRRLRNGSKE